METIKSEWALSHLHPSSYEWYVYKLNTGDGHQMCKTLSDHWDTLYWHHEDKIYIYYTLIVHPKQSTPDCLVNHLKKMVIYPWKYYNS